MIIFLHGEDTYHLHKKLKEIKKKFIEDVDKSSLNITYLEGEKLTFKEFLNSCRTVPFLARKRMVIIRNLILKNRQKEIFFQIAESLNSFKEKEENVIVFLEEGSLREKKKNLLFQRLSQEKFVQEFPLLRGKEVVLWIEKEVKKRGGQIGRKEALRLFVLVGNNLWALDQEIEKLIAYKNKELIKLEDINLLIKGNILYNVFDLVDALGNKDILKFLKIVEEQIKNVDPGYLFAMLVRQIRLLIKIKALWQEQRLTKYQIAQNFSLPLFVGEKLLFQARNFLFDELKKIYQIFLEIDYQIKTNQAPLNTLLDLLAARLSFSSK